MKHADPGFPLHQALVDLALGSDQMVGSHTRLVCIDGKAGAGKTTLTALVAAELGSRDISHEVVHMDDLYEGWGGLLAARDVVVHDLLEPLVAGGRARYRHFDWEQNSYTHTVEVPRVSVILLEGCGSAPPEVDALASLVLFIDAPDDLRLARGLARDGVAARAPWLAFMADEEQMAQRDGTFERAAVVLNERAQVLRWPNGSDQVAPEATASREDRLVLHTDAMGEDR